ILARIDGFSAGRGELTPGAVKDDLLPRMPRRRGAGLRPSVLDSNTDSADAALHAAEGGDPARRGELLRHAVRHRFLRAGAGRPRRVPPELVTHDGPAGWRRDRDHQTRLTTVEVEARSCEPPAWLVADSSRGRDNSPGGEDVLPTPRRFSARSPGD